LRVDREPLVALTTCGTSPSIDTANSSPSWSPLAIRTLLRGDR
jgi:hypothetical protein